MLHYLKYVLVFAFATFSMLACGTEPAPETATPVRSLPTATPEPTATPTHAPADGSDEISLTPVVSVDDEGVTIERGMNVSKNTLGVSSSTTYSPQTGKTTTSTTYYVDDTLVDFPWIKQITTPASTEMACNTIGTPGSWRGNPLRIGDEIAVNEIKLRIDNPAANSNTLLLAVENVGNESVEVLEYAFELIEIPQAQSYRRPRNPRPSFAETFDLGIEDTKSLTIILNSIADKPVKPENFVLVFSDWESGDKAYLDISEPPSNPHICNAFEPHAGASEIGTSWLTRPAPLGRAVKVDDATTVRITYAERGTPEHLIQAYDGLDLDVAYPKNANGELADGYEILAFQIEVASNYPLMKGDNSEDPIGAISVLGRVTDDYSLEFESIFSTPNAANLAMIEEPSGTDELNVSGYMRLSFVAVTPVEAYDLIVVYALDYSQIPVFLSLEENPRPRPTPVPVAQNADDARVGFLHKLDALGEKRVPELLEALNRQEKIAYEGLIQNCAQHIVFPSAESRRKVASDAETIGISDFAEALPEYFTNFKDADAFCNDLFPPRAITSMVQTLLLDKTSGLRGTCSLYGNARLSYISIGLMWQAEVALALWGEDAPVSIDSFANIYELCDWLESYEPNS